MNYPQFYDEDRSDLNIHRSSKLPDTAVLLSEELTL